MKVVFCGFGNPDNRGCEAIIRTTSEMVKQAFPHAKNIALSNDCGRTPMIDLPTIDQYKGSYYPHDDSFDRYIYAGLKKLFGSAYAWCKFKNRKNYKGLDDADLCISVGGDNFCYGHSIEHFLIHHDHFKQKGAKLVHWGSSFEKSLLPARLIEDLNQFDAIMVRESLSYDALREAGVTAPIYLIPDPAFTMAKEEIPETLPMEENCVGLNISPMVISKESQANIVRANTIHLINHITHSGRQVVLIPHVCNRKTGEGDYSVMKELLNEVEQPERCLLIGYGYTAPQLKYIISKCSMFIGARTHATIAAYSTLVPTVVVGYSVKARGIAKDLFGDDEKYVLPVQSLQSEQDFVQAYDFLAENQESIKNILVQKMPAYIEAAHSAVQILQRVMEGDHE